MSEPLLEAKSSAMGDRHPDTKPISRSMSSKSKPNADAVAEFDTDVVYDGLTFTKKGVRAVSWNGMPTCCPYGPFTCCPMLCKFMSLVSSMEKYVMRSACLGHVHACVCVVLDAHQSPDDGLRTTAVDGL